MKRQDKTVDPFKDEIERLRLRVAELEKTNEELPESESRFRRLAETGRDVLWTISLDFKYTYVSPSVTELLGYTVEEIMALNPLEILTPDSRALVIRALQEELAKEHGNPRSTFASRFEEIDQYHKDGSIRHLGVATTFLRDQDGRPVGIVGISHDISDRKAAERALQAEKDKLEALLNHSPFGILVADREGQIRFLNPQAKELLGYDPPDIPNREEFLRKTAFPSGLDPQASLEWKEYLNRARPGDTRSGRSDIRCKDGSVKTISYKHVMLESGDRILAFEDITERSRTEEMVLAQRDLSIALSATSDLHEAMRLCIDMSLKGAGMDAAGIYLSHVDSGLRLEAYKGISDAIAGRMSHLQYNWLEEHSIRQQLPLYLEVGEMPPEFSCLATDEGLLSAAIIPICHEGRVIGCFTAASRKSSVIDRSLRNHFEALAAQIGSAIARIRAEYALKKAHGELERRVSERTVELWKSWEQLIAQYKGIPVPTYTWQASGDDLLLVNFNDAAEMITQGRIVDFVGVTARDLYKHEPEIMHDLHRCFNEKTNFDRDMVYTYKGTGETKYLSVKYAYVPPDLVIVHTVDITDRKRAEEVLQETHEKLEAQVRERTAELVAANEELRREIAERKRAQDASRRIEERLRSTLSSIHDLVFVLDREGRFVDHYQPQGQTDLLYLPPEKFMDKSFRDVLPVSLASMLEDALRAVATTGRVQEMDYSLNLRGEERWFSAKMSELRDDSGHFAGVTAVVRDITERKQALEQLRASLEEKEVLLREIHHRVKNNLQVIQSLLHLQAKHMHERPHLDVFKDMEGRVYSMAMAHERLYRSDNLAVINIAQYFADLVEHLMISNAGLHPRVKVVKEIDGISLDLDTATPLGFILTELVANCLKHAFADGRGGELRIMLHSEDGTRFEMQVSDDGVGMPDGVDMENLKSLGLNLVRIFAHQLGGQVSITSEKGTRVSIAFDNLTCRGTSRSPLRSL